MTHTSDYQIVDAIADGKGEIPETALYGLHYYGTSRYFDSEVEAIRAQDRLCWYDYSASVILPTPKQRARIAAHA